jgi:hypothetical protein
MQCLIVTGVTAAANSAAIYLPYDKAPIPFGDPLVATLTAATGTVVTVPGYQPTLNDAVSFTFAQGTANLIGTQSFTGSLSSMFGFNQVFYATPTSTTAPWTFTLSTGKSTSTAGITSVSVWTAPVYSTQSIFIHLLSNQADGTTLPFKPGNTVLAINAGCAQLLGTAAFGAITLFGAADVSTTLATGTYGAPLGPNGSATTGWTVIATIGFGAPKLIQLNYDWIVCSGNTGTLVLLQN